MTPWRIHLVGCFHRVLNAQNDEVMMFDSSQLEFWRSIVSAVNGNVELLEVLETCRAYFENRSDVIDGDYGFPEPNAEMRLLNDIDNVFKRVRHSNG